jgi:hypothetical protein
MSFQYRNERCKKSRIGPISKSQIDKSIREYFLQSSTETARLLHVYSPGEKNVPFSSTDDSIFLTHAAIVSVRTLSVIIVKNKTCQYRSLLLPSLATNRIEVIEGIISMD